MSTTIGGDQKGVSQSCDRVTEVFPKLRKLCPIIFFKLLFSVNTPCTCLTIEQKHLVSTCSTTGVSPPLFYRLLQISHLYAKPPCCSSKFYMSIPLSLSLTEYTLSKISNWSPYIFTLVFNVRFDYTKFMLLLINQGFARTLQVISFKKYFLQRRC